ETKIIMGIVVASHTYPDPGCELEPEPEPESELPASPNPRIGIDPLTIADTGLGYVLVGQVYQSVFNGSKETFDYKGIAEVKCTQIPEVVIAPQYYQSWTIPVILNIQADVVRSRLINDVFVESTSGFSYYSTVPGYTSIIQSDNTYFRQISFGYGTFTSQYQTGPYPPGSGGLANGWVCFGSMRAIAKWVTESNKPFNGQHRPNKNIINQVIPVGKQLKKSPFLRPGVPPHMKDCCEDILDSLEDLMDVLHVDFFKKKKFPIPTYLLAPGCEPGKTTEAENYYHLFQKMFQAIAHNTIVSPQIDIQDADAVKEGDQKINERYLSATGWAEAVTKMLYEIVDDGNIGTNMDIRTGVTVTQLLVAVADLSHKVDCIIDCIGVTTKRSKGEVETSYNLVVEGENTKGFDPKKSNQQLDLNSDISTEKLLAGLLRTRKNPITKEEIHPKSPTLFELINDLKNK
ncbi:hypothetical protein, partial [Microcoleus sp. N9_A1]|uniref:hypothetical protein n=1 Tax=Microcoleus sp. N9_A1 TaxID=3055380 RepID=UPI002FD4C603